jgi:hypothetical protein
MEMNWFNSTKVEEKLKTNIRIANLVVVYIYLLRIDMFQNGVAIVLVGLQTLLITPLV